MKSFKQLEDWSPVDDIRLDEQGFPVMLAPPPSIAPGVDIPSTRSGNPAHVPRGQPGGGRFGTRRGKADTGGGNPTGAAKPGQVDPTTPPAGVAPEEWSRRRDAVREAAREFENFASQDIKDWLRGKITRPISEGEVQSFMRDVRQQQLDDLVDILDTSERGKNRGRRLVRVLAPRGYVRKTIGGLKDDELRALVVRLRSRGWSNDQVKRVTKHIPDQRQGVLDGLAIDTEWPDSEQFVPEFPVVSDDEVDLHALARRTAKEVLRQLPERQGYVFERDARGLITRVIPEQNGR